MCVALPGASVPANCELPARAQKQLLGQGQQQQSTQQGIVFIGTARVFFLFLLGFYSLELELEPSHEDDNNNRFGATARVAGGVTRSVIVIMIPQKIPGSGKNNPR